MIILDLLELIVGQPFLWDMWNSLLEIVYSAHTLHRTGVKREDATMLGSHNPGCDKIQSAVSSWKKTWEVLWLNMVA